VCSSDLQMKRPERCRTVPVHGIDDMRMLRQRQPSLTLGDEAFAIFIKPEKARLERLERDARSAGQRSIGFDRIPTVVVQIVSPGIVEARGFDLLAGFECITQGDMGVDSFVIKQQRSAEVFDRLFVALSLTPGVSATARTRAERHIVSPSISSKVHTCPRLGRDGGGLWDRLDELAGYDRLRG